MRADVEMTCGVGTSALSRKGATAAAPAVPLAARAFGTTRATVRRPTADSLPGSSRGRELRVATRRRLRSCGDDVMCLLLLLCCAAATNRFKMVSGRVCVFWRFARAGGGRRTQSQNELSISSGGAATPRRLRRGMPLDRRAHSGLVPF